jgi:hypothetical protein
LYKAPPERQAPCQRSESLARLSMWEPKMNRIFGRGQILVSS